MSSGIKKWGLLILSSLLLNGAFLSPYYFFWLTFIFLVPLFYIAIFFPQDISFLSGFVWGIFFFSLHFLEFFFLLYRHAQGDYRLLLVCLLILYCALYAGLWFFLIATLTRYFQLLSLKMIILIGMTTIYFTIMENSIFWIFGLSCGYCFANPLLPMAAHPSIVWLLPKVGSVLLITFIGVFSAFLTLGLTFKKKGYGAIAIVSLLPLLFGRYQSQENFLSLNESFYKQICYVPPPTHFVTALDCAQEIAKNIQKERQKKPDARLFLMPESSFPFPLNQMPEILELWELNALFNDANLILGGHAYEGTKKFNTFFIVQGTRIIQDYVKKQPMLFTEYVPFPWNKFSYVQKLFLKESKEFSSKEKVGDLITLKNNFCFEPAICSDLYMRGKFSYPHIPIMCIVNESWFYCSYFKRLMFLYARYYAMKHERVIFYIAHAQGVMIDKAGALYQC